VPPGGVTGGLQGVGAMPIALIGKNNINKAIKNARKGFFDIILSPPYIELHCKMLLN